MYHLFVTFLVYFLALDCPVVLATWQLPSTNSYSSSSANGGSCSFSVSGQTHGNGAYSAQLSSVNPSSPENQAYYAFDSDTSTYYTSYSNYYTGSGNSYSGSTSTAVVGGSTLHGEWLQVQVPSQSLLMSFYIATRPNADSRFPCNGVMVGSNDGSNWYSISSFNFNK